jgi:hypothetical protein
VVSFEELLLSQLVHQEALTRLLLDKGIISRDEFLTTVKVVGRERKRTLNRISSNKNSETGPQHPTSIEETVQLLLIGLSEKDQQAIRMMAEDQLSWLHFSLGNYIRNVFGLWGSNVELLKACCPDSSLQSADVASAVIIKTLWWKLQPVQ